MLLKLTGSIAVLGLTALTAMATPVFHTNANTRLAAVSQMSVCGDVSGLGSAFGEPAQPRLGKATRIDSLPTGSSWGDCASLGPARPATWSQFLIGR